MQTWQRRILGILTLGGGAFGVALSLRQLLDTSQPIAWVLTVLPLVAYAWGVWVGVRVLEGDPRAAERALGRRDNQIAPHRRADHGAELVEQLLLVHGRQWQCAPHGVHDAVAITDQEEREVRRDEQAGGELERVLAKAEDLCCDETDALLQPGVQRTLKGIEVHQPEALEQRGRPSRQRVEHAAKV